jgi:hypothetical protein
MLPRHLLTALLVFLGAVMIAVGWILEDDGYVSDLLLQLGSTTLLIVPVIYLERIVNRQIGEVRDQLHDLRNQIHAVSTDYERIRETVESGRTRTAALQRTVDDARQEASGGRHTAAEVAELFKSGSDGERVTALGMMQGNHTLTNVDAILAAISHSRSAFEQYQALFLALKAWDSLQPSARRRILKAVKDQMQPDGYIRPRTDRHALALNLLSLASSTGSH